MVVLLFVSLYAVLSRVLSTDTHGQGTTSTGSGSAGLALSYTLPIVSALQNLISSFTETEKEMISVERTQEYTDIPPETAGDREEKERQLWPVRGAISFRNLTVKYAPHLPPALQNVTLDVKGGEKVGIVGRTGGGKSTLFLALWRLVPWQGSSDILIDGVSIAALPRQQLRSALSIIPQDPLLFSGTVRFNLDPLGCHSDAVRAGLYPQQRRTVVSWVFVIRCWTRYFGAAI
jgi:ATP-binding cassette, subfamily C (CFTR/MRP), member 10